MSLNVFAKIDRSIVSRPTLYSYTSRVSALHSLEFWTTLLRQVIFCVQFHQFAWLRWFGIFRMDKCPLPG